jgi:hypothetical protein
MKRQHYLPPLITLVNLRARDAAAAGSRYFYFSFYFSSTAKSAGGFVCPSRKVAGSKPKTKKKTGPARRHRGDKAETASISAAAAPSYRVARHRTGVVKNGRIPVASALSTLVLQKNESEKLKPFQS